MRESKKTTIKKTTITNNINGNKVGIRNITQTKNRLTITTVTVSSNSFFPNDLPNSSFIITHDYFSNLQFN